MTHRQQILRILTVLLLGIALSACGGAEERKAQHFAKGEELFEQQNYEKARLEFKNVLQIDPKDIPARFRLAETLEKLQEWRAAAGHYKAVVEQDPTHIGSRIRLGTLYLLGRAEDQALELAEEVLAIEPRNADALVIRSGVKVRQGDLAGAMTDGEAALSSNPGHTQAASVVASLLLRDGKQEEAEGLLRTAVEGDPENVGLKTALAAVYTQGGDIQRAGELLSAVVELEPENPAHRMRLAVLFAGAQQLDKAESVLREAVKDLPENTTAKLALAEFLAKSQGPDSAIGLLEGYVREAPEDHALRFALAQLHEGKGERAVARSAYNKIIEMDEDGVNGLKARNALARLSFKEGDRDQAAELVDEVLEVNAKDIEALTLRGDLALLKGDALSAIADYRATLRSKPRDVAILRALAKAHLVNGERDLAIDTLKTAIEAHPKDIKSRVDLAAVLAQEGDLDASVAQLEEVLEIDPVQAEVLEGLVKLHMGQKSWEKAQQYVDRYKQAYPDRPHGYYFAGLIAQARGMSQEGIEEFEQSLEQSPGAVQPLSAVVRSYLVTGQADRALERLDKAIVDTPTNFVAHNLRGEVLLLQKQYPDAEQAFRKALDLNGNLVTAWRNLALARFAQGDREAAVAAYREGIEATSSELLRFGLANLYEGLGQVDNAIRELESLVAENPRSKAAANNLAMLFVTYKEDRESLARAAELVRILEGSQEAAFLDTIGWTKYKQGDYSAALPILKQAAEATPDASVMQYHLGMTYYQLGDQSAALDHLEKAVAAPVGFRGKEVAEQTLAKLK